MLILTLGLEGRDIKDVMAVIAGNTVELVVDVRLSPSGGMTSKVLETATGGRYRHMPELGSTTMRASARKGDKVKVKALDRGLRILAPAFELNKVWLMVGEPENPAECSRGVVADAIQSELTGVAVRHLRKPAPAKQGALL